MNYYKYIFVFIALLLILSGCEREKLTNKGVTNSSKSNGEVNGQFTEKDQTPTNANIQGRFEVRLFPHKPTSSKALSVYVNGASNIREYRWERNGATIQGEAKEMLNPDLFSKGDKIGVTVIADNGQVSTSSLIYNSPPRVIKVKVQTRTKAQGEEIQLIPEGTDPDDDPIEYRYTWIVDGSEDPDTRGATYVAKHLKQGDKIGFIVTPFDGEDEGFIYQGNFRVNNAAPRFNSTPPKKVNGSEYRYLAQADDPDSNTLTYSLLESPEEMTIDSKSGQIAWKITDVISGHYPVKVQATDEHGKKAIQSFDVVVARQ